MIRAPCLALVFGLAGCAGPMQVAATPTETPHLGDAWFEHRAASLGIGVDAARVRDAELPLDRPPEGLDTTTAREAAVLWRDLCSSCHGEKGRNQNAPAFDPPPRTWGGMGVRMGFLFGGDKMRAGIYRRIAEGGETESSPMPAWSSQLSREQIWALVRHIEGF